MAITRKDQHRHHKTGVCTVVIILWVMIKGAGALSQDICITRRDVCKKVFTGQSTLVAFQSAPLFGSLLVGVSQVSSAVGDIGSNSVQTVFGLSDKAVSSLVYERCLGEGSFKTVYLVSSDDGLSYALAVQKVGDKAGVKDGLRGVHVSEELQRFLVSDNGKRYFETSVDWWFQAAAPCDFEIGGPVFKNDENSLGERTRKPPSRFLGYRYLVAIKPVYTMDLEAFCKQSRNIHPLGEKDQQPGSSLTSPNVIAGVPLTEAGAIHLALEMMHAGRLMHAAGLVHRDIKPSNIMLKDGHPILIDFGFSQFVDASKADRKNGGDRICIKQPGVVKGEPGYVLAKDVAAFQGCEEGDAYAMGKTLYEVLFGDDVQRSPASKKAQEITVDGARRENERFRNLIDGSSIAGPQFSRFRISKSARDAFLTVIRGLCRDKMPITFADAETLLQRFSDGVT